MTGMHSQVNDIYLDANTLSTPFSRTTQIGFQPNRRTFWTTEQHSMHEI